MTTAIRLIDLDAGFFRAIVAIKDALQNGKRVWVGSTEAVYDRDALGVGLFRVQFVESNGEDNALHCETSDDAAWALVRHVAEAGMTDGEAFLNVGEGPAHEDDDDREFMGADVRPSGDLYPDRAE